MRMAHRERTGYDADMDQSLKRAPKPPLKPALRTALSAGDREILDAFDRARAKTIALLKIVPAKSLTRKAEAEDVSIGELFHHIAASTDGWMARCMQDRGPMPGPYQPSRPAISKALSASRKRLLSFFKSNGGGMMDTVFTPSRQGKAYRFVGRNRVSYLTHHEVHHRGKIILALRQWGVTDIPFMPFDND
jgi:uncharacterized damage-inducible protein DinB